MPTTSELLLLADQQRPRTQQREIGPSDLGSCRKRTGFKLAGTEPVNKVGSVVAMIGSAVHDAVAQTVPLVAQEGDLVEHKVTFLGISGSLDRYEAATRKVIDTKTCSSRMLEHHKLHGPPHNHIWQVSFYAAGLLAEGRKVDTIRLEYLVRDNGEEWDYEQPFNPRDVRDAAAWLKAVRDADLAMLPRDYEPDSIFCRSCPFGGDDGGICWEGGIPGRDMRSVLYVEDPDAGKWADLLWIAREGKKQPTEDEKKAKGALSAVVPLDGTPTKCGDHWLRYDARGALKFVSEPRQSEFSL